MKNCTGVVLLVVMTFLALGRQTTAYLPFQRLRDKVNTTDNNNNNNNNNNHQAPNDAQGRIIDGQPVIDQCQPPFSSVVNIISDGPFGFVHYCTGTLLAPDLVVTAASCLFTINFNQDDLSHYYAVVGDRYLRSADRGGPNFHGEQRLSLAAIKFHSGYNLTQLGDNEPNNIALIKLATSATLEEFCVQPMTRYDAALSTSCPSFSSDCTIVGWGSLGSTDPFDILTPSPILNYGIVNVLTSMNLIRIVMARDYPGESYPLVAGVTMIARPLAGSYVGTCQYDHGSMVACSVNGQYHIRGILSTHDKCSIVNPYASPNRPMYVTDIEQYKTWIDACLADFSDDVNCSGQDYP